MATIVWWKSDNDTTFVQNIYCYETINLLPIMLTGLQGFYL